MIRFLCLKCGKVFRGSLYDKKLVCSRCSSDNYKRYSLAIQRYYKCNSCKHCFKITEVTAIQLIKLHGVPECTKCGSKVVSKCLKKEYLKYSGQSKKQLEFIKGLGGNPDKAKSKAEAGAYINALKIRREKEGNSNISLK